MPKWGFEICSHRWLQGLDDVLTMMATERAFFSNAGHCGDLPGNIVAEADRRASAVRRWFEGAAPLDELGCQVAGWLGERTPDKVEAARCFVELVQSRLFGDLRHEQQVAQVTAWRSRGAANEITAQLLAPFGLDDLLQNACGFKLLDRLDMNIRLIGGDETNAQERLGNCNGQLRLMWRDDPARYQTTRGYLWGAHAYLAGHDDGWLRAHKPDCAGAAIYALQRLSKPGAITPLRRWLAASFLQTTKLWCQMAMARSSEEIIPTWAHDLPEMHEALATQ